MHWVLQVIAAALVIAGTCFSAYHEGTHFTSTHGILGKQQREKVICFNIGGDRYLS